MAALINDAGTVAGVRLPQQASALRNPLQHCRGQVQAGKRLQCTACSHA